MSSDKQTLTRDIFDGCTQLHGSNYEKVGKCIDKSIESEAEGGFKVTEHGKKMLEETESERLQQYQVIETKDGTYQIQP